jgi:hypothetical protein
MKKLLLLFIAACICIVTNAQVPQYFPTSTLKAAYLFSGNAKDSSGNGNDGMAMGATLTTDRFGNTNSAYFFDGVSNYIDIGSVGMLDFKDTNFSVSLWIKASDYTASGGKLIFWHGDAAVAHDPYVIYIASGQLYFRRDVGLGTTINQIGFPTSIIDTNKWHHIVATYENITSKMSLYYDGSLIKQQVLPGTIGYSTAGFSNQIGSALGGGGTQYYYGKIDEIGAWNRVLTSCEVKRLYYAKASMITSNTGNDTVIAGAIATYSITDIDTVTSYQWQVNAGSGFTNVPSSLPYVGTTTKTLIINPTSLSMNGYLYRCVRNSNTCNDTSTVAKLVVKTAGVNSIAANNSIDIYPNPAHDNITIEISGNNKAGNIQILNTIGQVVETKNIYTAKTNIDITSLPAGIYLVQVTIEGNKVIQKIEKQ